MPESNSDFFQTAHKLIDLVLNTAVKGKLAEYSSMAVEFAQYGVTIYIIIYAMQTMAGRQKTPVPDFLWNMGKMAVIFMFVSNMDGWLDSANKAIDDMRISLAGGIDPWKWLDQLWIKNYQVANLLKKLDTDNFSITGDVSASVTYIGSSIALLTASIVFFSAEITLKILTTTAPIFIMCLMFGFLRQMFNNWLQLIFSSLFTILFSTLALRAGTSYLNHILSVLVKDAEKANLIAMAFTALAAGIFTAYVAWKAAQFATQIASVGVEGAMQGAAAMGLGAATFGASKLIGKGRQGLSSLGDAASKSRDKAWQGASDAAAQQNAGIGKRVAKKTRERYEG
ncbi:TPA: type IV secretion system protein [Klebsiella pneumoniae subsp. pneumoniae]|nr:type IV secretion system protein [Salmonella enterica]EJB9345432.1 type IV secretion system protein [Salmonella enterica]EJT4720272.1 type IV secretion system protein [Salmonella enterica]HDS4694730.1 type IV secretion system protein [Klebsiella pneumoniae subsp. pneumoniae]